MATRPQTAPDPTANAIRNAFSEGVAHEQARAEDVLALRVADARLEAAALGIDAALAALVRCPTQYTTDDGRGLDSFGEGRSIHASLRREREAIERRRDQVRTEIAARRAS